MSGPHEDEHPAELTPVEGRQGMMTGHMRYVLAISLSLAVIMMIVIWLAYFG